MPISKETYASGMTADEYLAIVEANREKFLENVEANEFSAEDLDFFSNNPISVAAIGEDWCTDVVQFMPVMIKLSKVSDAVDLRVFQRDKTDLIESYLNQGVHKSIPVFVIYDSDWNELGYFIERPARVTDLMAAESARFARENPHLEGANRSYANMPDETREAVRANSSSFRWANMDTWNQIFIDDIKSIVAGGVGVAD